MKILNGQIYSDYCLARLLRDEAFFLKKKEKEKKNILYASCFQKRFWRKIVGFLEDANEVSQCVISGRNLLFLFLFFFS
jgi:hypothetical protein